jgi:membrane-associated protein
MDFLSNVVYTIFHLTPDNLNALAHQVGGTNLSLILFAIIFAETGLVVFPILPGDSLLFVVGTVAAHPDAPIGLAPTAVLLVAAAVLGDAVNYFVGSYVGPAVFHREDSWWFNKKHLNAAHEFYEKYGAKTIILARFVPIVRTFAPFVAGIGAMNYFKFALYNVVGGVAWVLLCLLSGWKFGNLEVVKKNFELVLVAIVVISVLPGVVGYIRSRGPRDRTPTPV